MVDRSEYNIKCELQPTRSASGPSCMTGCLRGRVGWMMAPERELGHPTSGPIQRTRLTSAHSWSPLLQMSMMVVGEIFNFAACQSNQSCLAVGRGRVKTSSVAVFG